MREESVSGRKNFKATVPLPVLFCWALPVIVQDGGYHRAVAPPSPEPKEQAREELVSRPDSSLC